MQPDRTAAAVTFMKLVLATAAALMLIPAAIATAKPSAYLDAGSQPDIMSQHGPTTYPVMGPEGVPRVQYPWGVEDNPTTIAQWALQHWSWYTTNHQPGELDFTLRAAEWFVAHQRADGAWPYLFNTMSAGQPLTAPWISAMAQGQAMSVLVRAYKATRDQRYLAAATQAVQPFEKTVASGGVVSDWNGLPWYEEYATPAGQHVLNGYEFALVGLHDLAALDADAAELFRDGVRSLVAHISSFDLPTQRNELYAAVAGGRFPVAPNYRQAHAVLTRELATITGDAKLSMYAARWESYLPAASTPAASRAKKKPWACRAAHRRIRRHGHVACRRARHVLARALAGRPILSRGWWCRGRARVTCHRRRDGGWVRLARPRPARHVLMK